MRWLDLAKEGDQMTLPGMQLVLRQALRNIWTVLRDGGVIGKKFIDSIQ
ncbi:Poly(A)-specific ribonuclease PARN-like domain-containing protein 1 [Fukomys damarensis]|uniref:Poly(A)-specific ribonuclease PARN-like domain-containing protein 1 n=1 Tax=Fukomys damarensis TaxID=885580 RepID=A0A091E7F5_FUKDA|nr:Poly(A)-specific ribonuclease PARN-like domain-containing protein 1 [Fukomys damarensis]